MKRIMLLCSAAAALLFLSACRGAEGDGPDAPPPRKVVRKKTERQKNFLKEQLKRDKISDRDINKPGAIDDFQVYPTRSGGKRRSESLSGQSSPFPWR